MWLVVVSNHRIKTMTPDSADKTDSVMDRAVKRVLPIIIVSAALVTLYLALHQQINPVFTIGVVILLCIMVLWMGWKLLHGSVATKWIATVFAVGLALGLIAIAILGTLLVFRTKEEKFAELRNGDFKVLVRSQEFGHSGSVNVDVCVTQSTSQKFPKNEQLQCFFHGYDFSGLSVRWDSERDIVVSFKSGYLTRFTNSAIVTPSGALLVAFHATIHDGGSELSSDDGKANSRDLNNGASGKPELRLEF
jgi:hypothetical protein